MSNQVSCSVIDRRLIRGRLGKICIERGVGVLAYGTLLGGFISEKWLGKPEPPDQSNLNWSLCKYLRFIQASGGWEAFQAVLQALADIAQKHKVSIATVALRYVLDCPSVSAVIVGTRLSNNSESYARSNLAAFSIHLDEQDHALIEEAQGCLRDIPGDCGDEYRRPPFLTAAGDLSHHLKTTAQTSMVEDTVARGLRVELMSGSKWESIAV